MKYLVLAVAVLLAGALGWVLSARLGGPSLEDRAVRVEDQIRRVAKLATAEGQYVRMYRYVDEGSTSWLPFTDQRVVVQARARVVMGFDLEGVSVTVDREAGELVVEGWPEPEEIAFEFDSELFDVSEGLFVDIGKDVLNAVERGARKRMRERIDYARLRSESYAQADELLAIVRVELADAGYGLRVAGWPTDVAVALD